jgi:hypothetical protein
VPARAPQRGDDGAALGLRFGFGCAYVGGACVGRAGVGSGGTDGGGPGSGASGSGGDRLWPNLGDPGGKHRDELVVGTARRVGHVPWGDEACGEPLDELVVGAQRRDVERVLGVALGGAVVLGGTPVGEIVLVSEPHPDLRSS